MQQNILDRQFLDLEDLKKCLKEGGILRFFEKKNGSIVVQESDAVQISIRLKENQPVLSPNFPQIGNGVQVLVTIILFFMALFLDLPFSFLLAILLGQVISFLWFYPKIKLLKSKVIKALA